MISSIILITVEHCSLLDLLLDDPNMFNQRSELLTFNMNSEDAVKFILDRLQRAGLHVIQSFDLRETSTDENDCHCAVHKNSLCDCQLVVLLVYDLNTRPATLIVQGNRLKTYLSLVEMPDQIVDEDVKKKLFDMLIR